MVARHQLPVNSERSTARDLGLIFLGGCGGGGIDSLLICGVDEPLWDLSTFEKFILIPSFWA